MTVIGEIIVGWWPGHVKRMARALLHIGRPMDFERPTGGRASSSINEPMLRTKY